MDSLKSLTLFFWLPRILTIIAIVFVSLFALDAFSSEASLEQQWKDFVIHLVPSYLLTVILVIAWKWEYMGGILFLLIGLISSPYVFVGNYHNNNSVAMSLLVILLVTIPFVVVGILFLASYYKHKRNKAVN